MTTRTHFTFRIDMLDPDGEVFAHVAGIEDFEFAMAAYEAACKRWPSEPIMLRQGARVVKDTVGERGLREAPISSCCAR